MFLTNINIIIIESYLLLSQIDNIFCSKPIIIKNNNKAFNLQYLLQMFYSEVKFIIN